MNKKWYYLKEEKAHGPLTWDKILSLYKDEIIDKETKVWSSEHPNWVELNEVLITKPEENANTPVNTSIDGRKLPPLSVIQPTSSYPAKSGDEKDYANNKGYINTRKLLIVSGIAVILLIVMGLLYGLIDNKLEPKHLSQTTSSSAIRSNAQIYYHGVNIQSTQPPQNWKHPNGYNFYLKKLDGVFDHVLCTPNSQGIVYIFVSKDHSEHMYKELLTSLKKQFGTPKDLSPKAKGLLKEAYNRRFSNTEKARKITMWLIAPHFGVTLMNTTKDNSVTFANKYK